MSHYYGNAIKDLICHNIKFLFFLRNVINVILHSAMCKVNAAITFIGV
jgi:hypothetical protein